MINKIKKYFENNKSQSQIILEAIKKQRDYDAEQLKKALEENDKRWFRELTLQRDSYEAQLKIKNEELRTWERRKSDIEEREYLCKQQININYHIAQRITLKTGEATKALAKELEEIKGCFDDAEAHHDEIKKLEMK